MTYTRNGIIYNLPKSKYRYSTDKFEFFFSSLRHLEKFSERLVENRNATNLWLSNKYGLKIMLNDLADLMLYVKIETRGFYIRYEHKEIRNLRQIVFIDVKDIRFYQNKEV